VNSFSKRFLFKLSVFLLTFAAGIALWWNLIAAPISDSLVPSVNYLSPNIIISDKDKMEIIVSVLSQYKVMQFKPKSRQAVSPKFLYLSTTNLPAPAFKNFPQTGKTDIILLLVSHADKTMPLPAYVEFSEFDITGDTVSVSLMTYFSSGNTSGGHYEYRKIAGHWQLISRRYSAAGS
jgi:hypothetical protein